MSGEAARWRSARDKYIALGLHPSIAGHLALAWMDSDAPESLEDAFSRLRGGLPDQPTTRHKRVSRTAERPTP